MASPLAAAQLSASISALNGAIQQQQQKQQQQQQLRENNAQLRLPGSMRQARSRGVFLDRREMMAASTAAVFLSLADVAHAAKGEIETAEEAATNPLIQKLLESSRAHKAAYDAERLEDYYRRNFKEYFEFVEGSVRNKKELTPAEKAIVEWLAKNK